MSAQRVRLIGVTVTIFVLSLGAVFFMAREIISQSVLLEQQIATLQKDLEQQSRLSQLKRLIEDTETDRETIAGYYLQSQSDSIDFLNYTENLAIDAGVLLSTERASETERADKTNVLTVAYDVSGSQFAVERFISLLEVIPYVSEVTSVKYSRQSTNNWSAAITIEVVILDYESNI